MVNCVQFFFKRVGRVLCLGSGGADLAIWNSLRERQNHKTGKTEYRSFLEQNIFAFDLLLMGQKNV